LIAVISSTLPAALAPIWPPRSILLFYVASSSRFFKIKRRHLRHRESKVESRTVVTESFDIQVSGEQSDFSEVDMAEDEKDAYLAAYAAAAAADKTFDALVKTVDYVASQLLNQRWRAVRVGPFANAIKLDGWPSREDLYRAIDDFNEKRERAYAFWANVQNKVGLIPPETLGPRLGTDSKPVTAPGRRPDKFPRH
jgi:hypothetical protein